MKKSKMLSIFLAAMAFTSVDHALANSTIGCRGGWYLALEPFVAKINDDWINHRFARLFPAVCDNSHYRLNDNDYNWGGHIALGYDFRSCSPCYYWGASLEYTHLKSDDHNQTPNDVLVSSEFGGINFGPYTYAKADFNNKYDAVDLLAHYHFNTPCCIQTQLFAGLRYARIDESFNTHYHFEPTPGTLASDRDLFVSLDRDFKGFGPEIGLGVFAPIYNCFGVAAEVAGGYLSTKRNHQFTDRFDVLPTSDDFFILNEDGQNHDDDNKWVGFANAHIGLSYQTTLCNCNTLGIEAGYRYDRYFNALETWNNYCGCDNHHGKSEHDFEFQGPYLKLSWHM